VTVDLDAVERIIAAEAAGHAAIEDQAVAGVRYAYDGVDFYDHAAITVAATQAGEVVRALSQASTALADAAVTRRLAEMLGGSPIPAGALTITQPLRNGVSGWSAIYGRVADTVRFQVSQGVQLDEAVGMGLARGDTMCKWDLGLARREQWRRSLTACPDVIGYRRVTHPELSKGVCGLCIAAASRIYNRGDLLPLHGKCHCGVAEVTRKHDPGETLNNQDLESLYGAAGSTARQDLARVRYQVVEHGELGPILVRQGDHFRGVDEVARARQNRAAAAVVDVDASRTVEQLRATLAGQERSLAVFESPGVRARIAELQAKIAART
jgi:hypothetical protein